MDCINKKEVINVLAQCYHDIEINKGHCITDNERDFFFNVFKGLTALSSFDITTKINKAYDDGYEAGYLQGMHDWSNVDE